MVSRFFFLCALVVASPALGVFSYDNVGAQISVERIEVKENIVLLEVWSQNFQSSRNGAATHYRTQVVDEDGAPTLFAYYLGVQGEYYRDAKEKH